MSGKCQIRPVPEIFVASGYNVSQDEWFQRTAYKIRIMLSHVRMKFDAWAELHRQGKHVASAPRVDKHHPDKLRLIYELFTRSLQQVPSPASGSGTPRSADKKRPHPVIAFRHSFDDPDVAADEKQEVFRDFSIADLKAYIVHADGSRHPPEKYEPGDDGFVVATWSNGATLKTEVS
jgi:hypothetical protein